VLVSAAIFVAAVALGQRGTIVVPLEQVPGPARAAIEGEAQGQPILAVTASAGDGSDVVYEALVQGQSNTVGVAVDERGRRVARFIMPEARGVDGR
jgi:hypothetical protein